MQSSFDVLEWESTSKAQDSLVHQLFGDVSTSKLSTCSAVLLESTCSATQQVNASKGEKRKTLKNEESTVKLKKTKQNKRQKNKFKQVQQFSSERSETTINKANENNIDITTAETEGQVSGHMASEKSNGHERKKEKKRRKSHETKEKDVSSKTAKKNVKTSQKSNSQLTENRDSQSGTACNDEVISTRGTNQRVEVSVDTTASLNADREKILNSTEGSHKSDSEKEKKKKKREKRRLDSSRDASAILKREECTSEVSNNQPKRRRKTSESDQDSCCDKKISKLGPAIKDTNSNILSSSCPQSKSSLQEKMTKKLESSRFRWINEQLYTTTGDEAVAMFSKDPKLFDIYHRGFTNQVKLWPVNPVDKIIEWLKKR